MGGKRKKRTKIIKPKPKLPKTFECPRCGRISISIEIKEGLAKIKCGNCGLYTEIEVPPVYDEANAYGKFIDLYLDGKLKIEEGNNESDRLHTSTE
ncbi:transcription elongation factor [Acidianus sulfidivorans JP7]|uniref:Transcription elongation factor n=1 Tax=Acidianus sulfidivorans JP7 TaxID=619593 RepID=A0A2U9IMJ3_9CREN|nr:transcription elongation factor [Acidianus sulfidivorans]AWR97233.1 transcription elongation factor [Acidianus sulfidivorans JP7]